MSLAPFPLEIEPAEVNDHSYGDYQHQQWIYRFPNGYGASVIWGTIGPYCNGRDGIAYDPAVSTYELAVLRYDDAGEWHLTYETPITSDVLGWQSLAEVAATLLRVAAL